MSVSPGVQAIICEEIFDESSHPSVEEINEYATKIGIDPSVEPHLLHLAKEGLMQALPPDWKPCFDEKSKSYYYYNGQTGRTQWEHPLDDMYRSLVTKVRSGSQASFEEDSKGHEDHTYTKEDLQSFEESLPKPLSFAKPPLSPVKKLEPISLGARKKDLKLSPVKVKSKSMQDFGQKSNEFLFERTEFGKRKNSGTNIFQDAPESGVERNTEISKNFLLKNDKHPNTIEKGELTLSGGGSMFLKSNTKKLVSQISDSQLDFGDSGAKSLENEYLPKSILRDRSLPETHSYKEFAIKEIIDDKRDPEDDKKSVRFNLETTNQEIEFNFSDSEQKSTSEEIEILVESKFKKPEITIKPSRFTVSPVIFDEYGPNSKRSESIFAKIENAEKLEENSSPRNTNLKLIKPNPIDFITPKIIGKPLDVVKPISLLSDSDEESGSKYKAKYPSENALITEKLSNIQDSIPEELADRSEISVEVEDVPDSKLPEKINNNEIEKIKQEMKINLEKCRKELLEENVKEIENLKQTLLARKKEEIDKLRQTISESQKIELDELLAKEKENQEERIKIEILKLKEETEAKYKKMLDEEEERYQMKLNERKIEMEQQFNKTLDEIEKSFRDKEKEIESNFQMSLKQTETDFLLKLEERIKEISQAHKQVLDRMRDDHELTLAELLRDFKSEEEIIRKEHQQNLSELRDRIAQELEIEKQKMRDLGEDRLYEKVRCEKRLLEDKYRCLKEKYLRLKTDVKVSLERRNRRKEQSLTTTTGSDTERSTSHKKGSNSERTNVKSQDRQPSTPKHLPKPNKSDINSNRTKADNKNVQQIIIEDLDTSMSDKSTSKNNNDKKDRDIDSSDGVSNHGRSRRKLFTRLKSSSTSRLNNNASKNKEMKRSCSPVENLRRQLQKLEDLEDQFPQTAPTDTYHLRYPFSDAGVEHFIK